MRLTRQTCKTHCPPMRACSIAATPNFPQRKTWRAATNSMHAVKGCRVAADPPKQEPHLVPGSGRLGVHLLLLLPTSLDP